MTFCISYSYQNLMFWLVYIVVVVEPCPSPKFQSLLADMLVKDSEAATRFLDTLLNQLNWSFSEFIGMMQEVSF